jgi:hypothetical protein
VRKVFFWSLIGIIIFSLGGLAFGKWSTSQTGQKKVITTITPPISSTNAINRFPSGKDAEEIAKANKEIEKKGENYKQLISLDGFAADMVKGVNNMVPEYSDFKYFLRDTNRLKNDKDSSTFIASTYIYAKYFLKVEPKYKADEGKLLEQATKVVKSNHAPNDVQDLKQMISQLTQKYN